MIPSPASSFCFDEASFDFLKRAVDDLLLGLADDLFEEVRRIDQHASNLMVLAPPGAGGEVVGVSLLAANLDAEPDLLFADEDGIDLDDLDHFAQHQSAHMSLTMSPYESGRRSR